jgi:hypothetical protein
VTLAEAWLIQGDTREASELYRAAFESFKDLRGNIKSTPRQTQAHLRHPGGTLDLD